MRGSEEGPAAPSRARRVVGCLLAALLVAAIALGVHTTVMNGWLASGPPTQYPEVYARRSVAAFQVTVCLIGVGLAWIAVLLWRSGRWLFVILPAVGLAVLAWWLIGTVRIGACLDRGGSWDYQAGVCRS